MIAKFKIGDIVELYGKVYDSPIGALSSHATIVDIKKSTIEDSGFEYSIFFEYKIQFKMMIGTSEMFVREHEIRLEKQYARECKINQLLNIYVNDETPS